MGARARAATWLLGLALLAPCFACGDDSTPPSSRPTSDAGPLDPASKDAGQDSGPMNTGDASAGDAAADDASTPEDARVPEDAVVPDPNNTLPDGNQLPSDWSCLPALYHDGYCDCGCTAHDIDCLAVDCTTPGCKAELCDACFTADNTWQSCAAAPDPSAWTCDAALRTDANCDCGCGVPDPACASGSCTGAGCRKPACQLRHNCGPGVTASSDDCQLNPRTLLDGDWYCPWDSYGAGDGCDCGCGALDPDCNGAGCTGAQCYQAACDRCNDRDGRPYACDAAQGGWDDVIAVTGEESQCDPAHFDAGGNDGCDCGCGGHDPDCGPTAGCDEPGCSDAACERCTDATTGRSIGCAPQAWLDVCPAENYGTGDGCDCGCGADDPDCATPGSGDASTLTAQCQVCHDGVGPYSAGTHSAHYVKCPSWTCTDPATWGTAQCDCGCGAIDPYCRDTGRFSCTQPGCSTGACDYCTDPGGTRGSCGENWSAAGTTCDLRFYGTDSLCDCGCGLPDPACGDSGCTEPGCNAPGCDACHAPTTLAVCDPWRCDAERFAEGGSGHCDCGCGAIDPDCGSGGCKDPGCQDAACDVCHDSHDRIVKCP